MLNDSFPLTEMVLKFTVADEEGITTTTTETITGDAAEHLPHILRRMEGFLSKVGFDVRLSVVDQEDDRLGNALKEMILAA